jgi:hypothetical protein
MGNALSRSRDALPPEVEAEAVAKRAATRKARGTMGRKQRLEITGAARAPATVAAPVVTPPVT